MHEMHRTRLQLYTLKQEVKVIWQKAASSPQRSMPLCKPTTGPLHPTCLTPSPPNLPSPPGSRSIIPILYYGTARSATQNCPFPVGGSGPPSNTWSLSPTPPHMLNGISIGIAVLPQYIRVTNDRQTHRQTDRT